jgi:hypothetical protein
MATQRLQDFALVQDDYVGFSLPSIPITLYHPLPAPVTTETTENAKDLPSATNGVARIASVSLHGPEPLHG